MIALFFPAQRPYWFVSVFSRNPIPFPYPYFSNPIPFPPKNIKTEIEMRFFLRFRPFSSRCGPVAAAGGVTGRPVHGSGLAVIFNQPAQPATKQVERFETHGFDGFRRIAMHVCRSSEALG